MSDAWKLDAACHPNNWPTLKETYGHQPSSFWWVPRGPGGSDGLQHGIRVCHEQCQVTAECELFGVLEEEGVWAGVQHGGRA
jgi:hypothetical protein